MAVKRISRAFKDINLSFTPHPVTKDLTVLRNENAIKRSVRNIVQTIPSERFFNSILGSDVRDLLFDNFVDFGTASAIEDQIIISIENFEPRVDLTGVKVTPNFDNNAFDVVINYDIIGIDVLPQQLTFALQPTR